MNFKVGQKVRAKHEIIEVATDDHPRWLLAEKGEELEVRGLDGSARWPLYVGVPGARGSFMVAEDEVEEIPHET